MLRSGLSNVQPECPIDVYFCARAAINLVPLDQHSHLQFYKLQFRLVARAFANAAPERLPSLAEFVIDHDGGFGADGVLCLALALCQHHHFDRATETLAKHSDLLKIANKSEMLKLRRLEQWLDKFHNASNFEPHSVKSDPIGIGVLSYRATGHNSSRKIGLCIQSLAVIAQLVKHFQTLPNSYFDGEFYSTLDAVARQMDIKKPAGSVSVFAADRDGISSTQISCHGWPLCYGWHAHHKFISDYDHQVPAHIHPFIFRSTFPSLNASPPRWFKV